MPALRATRQHGPWSSSRGRWTKGLVPNAITYSALIGACAEGDKAARALEPFQEIVDRGLVPRVITYSALSVPSQGATRQHGPWSSSRRCGPRLGAQRHHIQRLDLGRAEGDKAARALALLQDMRDLGPCAQRHHLQRLDLCLRRGRQGSTGPGARPVDAGPRAWCPTPSLAAP